ncbi:hypothetical protein F4083_07375 [Candidatus Poribacteria bacterium]|nr:hypothetical protein [Candidatus Poribacteria bacterium]MYB65705.1 hypothetical protein [Candidatus Poribacteria bacterium]MYF54838.1 hypothetical protein [Candidatus Poribacteria bacterium]MYI94132.1 hypothetical protein [Candidatus Poribacteria bacterium]
MRIALIGNSQLTLTVGWGICESELAQSLVIVSGTQAGSVQRNRHTKFVADAVEDLTLATAMCASDTQVTFTTVCEDISGSDLVVLLPTQLPYGFHSAQALKTANLSSARDTVPKILEHGQNAKVLVTMPFSNYISAWIHQSHGVENLIGIANGVSTAHLKSEIATRTGYSVKDVSGLVIGDDEETFMLPQYCRVNGIPLTQLLNEADIQSIVDAVASRCPYTTTSEYTLASHILQVISAISLDKKRVMSVGTLISTDTTSVFLNVPSKIGSEGIESIVPLQLTESQTEQFTNLVSQSAKAQSFGK